MNADLRFIGENPWLKFKFEIEVADDSNGFAVEDRGWEYPILSGGFGGCAEHCRTFRVSNPDFSVFIHNRENANSAGHVVAFCRCGIGRCDSLRFPPA